MTPEEDGGAGAGDNNSQGPHFLQLLGLVLLTAVLIAVVLQGLDVSWPFP